MFFQPALLVKLARDLTRVLGPQNVAGEGTSLYFREIEVGEILFHLARLSILMLGLFWGVPLFRQKTDAIFQVSGFIRSKTWGVKFFFFGASGLGRQVGSMAQGHKEFSVFFFLGGRINLNQPMVITGGLNGSNRAGLPLRIQLITWSWGHG